MNDKVIVFYDGDCGFCNRWVHFFLSRNDHQQFYFAPLGGSTSQDILGKESPWLKTLSTLVVRSESGELLVRSSAALYLFSKCRGPWKAMSIFKWVPTFIRDGVYRIISRTRNIWGKNYCVLPTEEQQKFFLD